MSLKRKNKAIVVTGAAGLIGSGVVSYLRGHSDLICVDQLDHPDKVRNLQGKEFRELIAIANLFSWLEGRESEIEAIIHLGACSDTMEANFDFLKENNTQYTIRLAEYALKHGIRFIYASSAATYGDGLMGFSDDHAQLSSLKPLNLYGQSKHLFDLWAQKEGVLDKIVGLKYFNVFGPNENHKGRMASMVYKMFPLVQKEKVVRLFKSSEPDKFPDGGQCRDFIYVKDAVRMTCDFLQDRRGGIFNIGMGRPTTWNQLATAIFHALNQPVNIEYIDMPADLVKQYQNYTCADMTKFSATHQLSFDYDIEKAVQDYIQEHLLADKRW
jgi:ADP-L-glycero-D-manno-heptose 6-epimerase